MDKKFKTGISSPIKDSSNYINKGSKMKHEHSNTMVIYEDNQQINTLSNRDAFSIHSSFNQTQSQFSQLALDIFFLLVTQVKKEDDELFLYETSLADIQRRFARRIKKESIEQASRELLDTLVAFKMDDNQQINTTLLSIFEYDNGTILFKLNDDLKDIVINPRAKYTVASLKEFLSLKSVYTKRLYLLIKQFSTAKEFIMHLKNIYNILNLQNKYERYSHFKNKILNLAIKSINNNTTLSISIYEHLRNRTVQHIKFTINTLEKQETIPKQKMSKSKAIASANHFEEVYVPKIIAGL